MANEKEKETKIRTKRLIQKLRKRYPSERTALEYRDAFELLVATILSAQCTDKRVNMVSPGLFRKYQGPKAFAIAEQAELEIDIRSTGFYRNKARNIIAASKSIVERFNGKVPQTMEELIQLGGVGRKTANCVLGGAFGINEGVVVDTHVERLSQRLGLTKEKNAQKIELDLMQVVPKKDWYDFSNLLIRHGREVCTARKPACPECHVRKDCPSAESFMGKFWK